ncbi:hypothetical protein [Dietzia sp. 179-F 9C3 NHS]
MISDIFNGIVAFINQIGGVGSTAAKDGFAAVAGSLGNIFG